VDPIFSNDIGSAQLTHDTTISQLNVQRANTAAEYGYTPTYDEQGLIRSLAVDPNNPYAKANLLKKSYTENRAGTLNNMASRGQLYAGPLGVAQGINDSNYQQGSNALQNAFIHFIANNQGQINATNTDWENAKVAADSARIARAVANDTGENGGGAAPAAGPKMNPLPGLGKLPLSTGFAGLDPSKRYRKASNGKLQVQNSNGTWRYV